MKLFGDITQNNPTSTINKILTVGDASVGKSAIMDRLPFFQVKLSAPAVIPEVKTEIIKEPIRFKREWMINLTKISPRSALLIGAFTFSWMFYHFFGLNPLVALYLLVFCVWYLNLNQKWYSNLNQKMVLQSPQDGAVTVVCQSCLSVFGHKSNCVSLQLNQPSQALFSSQSLEKTTESVSTLKVVPFNDFDAVSSLVEQFENERNNQKIEEQGLNNVRSIEEILGIVAKIPTEEKSMLSLNFKVEMAFKMDPNQIRFDEKTCSSIQKKANLISLLGHYYFHLGQSETAKNLIENLAEMDMENERLLRMAAYYFLHFGCVEEAIVLFKQLSKLAPFDPIVFRDLAIAHSMKNTKKEMNEAVKCLWKVVETKNWAVRWEQIGNFFKNFCKYKF